MPGCLVAADRLPRPAAPTLATLRGLVAAQATATACETIDPLLGNPPRLDIAALQRKIIDGGRGGGCFAQNTRFRAGFQAQARDARLAAVQVPSWGARWCAAEPPAAALPGRHAQIAMAAALLGLGTIGTALLPRRW